MDYHTRVSYCMNGLWESFDNIFSLNCEIQAGVTDKFTMNLRDLVAFLK